MRQLDHRIQKNNFVTQTSEIMQENEAGLKKTKKQTGASETRETLENMYKVEKSESSIGIEAG